MPAATRGTVAVEVHADACFHPAHGGFWAVWVVGPDIEWRDAGPCRRRVRTSCAAELDAVVRGIALARRLWDLRLGCVTVYSDSQAALHHVWGTEHQDPAAVALRDRLDSLRGAVPDGLYGVWVPSHQPVPARGRRRAPIERNRWCDRAAAKRHRKWVRDHVG